MLQSPTPSHSQHGVSGRVAKLTDLPSELLLCILEFSPDMSSLINASLSHPKFYSLFKAHEKILANGVLKIEIPEDVYIHARTAFSAPTLFMPNIDTIDHATITNCVENVAKLRDSGMFSEFLIPEALSLSKAHRKVVELTDTFFRECPRWRQQCFSPLQKSLVFQKESRKERTRVQQAIYMFEILRCLCGSMYVAKDMDEAYYMRYISNITFLQTCLVSHAFAPWEMHQVIAIQAFFRRQLQRFDREGHYTERAIAALLAKGIGFLHAAICDVAYGDRDSLLDIHEQEARCKPLCAFGMVLSRGDGQTWTRKVPRSLDTYNPFGGTASTHGIPTWKRIELKMAILIAAKPSWADTLNWERDSFEGRLDLWSASLWDEVRWENDIEPTLREGRVEASWGKDQHQNPFRLGLHLARNDTFHWFMEENVQG
ncbi:hypothetical protein BGZ63DRAFT_431345 [Mariannaea sp. PMI_226]|nr:hypothetical protein BGZ63DRAFT_431345 [Mariannaea sp. PMI_226]